LYQRRRRIALSKVESELKTESKPWGNLLARRLAFPFSDSRSIHTLFCPDGVTGGTYNFSTHEQQHSADLTSLAALRRIDESIRSSGENLRQMYEDEQLEGIHEGSYLDEASGSHFDFDGQPDVGFHHEENDDDLEAISRAFSDSNAIEEQATAYVNDDEDTVSMTWKDNTESVAHAYDYEGDQKPAPQSAYDDHGLTEQSYYDDATTDYTGANDSAPLFHNDDDDDNDFSSFQIS
jgi:hypothetical protein